MTQALQENIRAAAGRVAALRAQDSLVFSLFTDLHTDGAEHAYANTLCEALRAVAAAIPCDLAVDLGDNFSMLGRNHHITNEALLRVTEALIGQIAAAAGCPMLYPNGNHDAPGTDFYTPTFWNEAVKGRFGNAGDGYDGVGSYCYFDHAPSASRLVVLSCPSNSDFSGEMPTPVWALGDRQLTWLRDVALATTSRMIILMHVPPFSWYHGNMAETMPVFTGERAANATIASLCGWIADREELAAILQAFVERGGRLVACLSGHTHADSLWCPHEARGEERNVLPCPQVVTRGACIPPEAHKEYGVSLDVVVWTPSKNALTLVRVGDGEDRSIPLVQKSPDTGKGNTL